jgi:hypothetical protein
VLVGLEEVEPAPGRRAVRDGDDGALSSGGDGDRDGPAVVLVRRLRAVEADAAHVEADGVELHLGGDGIDALEVERGGAEDALLGDVERDVHREVLDLKRPVALEVPRAMGEREGASRSRGAGLVLTRARPAAGVEAMLDGHRSS